MGDPRDQASVTRYIVTHIGTAGERVMTAPARQGRYTYASPGEAQGQLDAMITNPTNDLPGVFGKQAVGTFEVRPVECWPKGFDPKHVYCEDEGG